MKKLAMLNKLGIIILLMVFGKLTAQDNDKTIILKAMMDELNRNMNELQYKDYDLPFYISYHFSDGHYWLLTASNGGTTLKLDKPIRRTNNRVMSGDYHLSDENFRDRNQSPYDYGDIAAPIDNDYEGIRRAFWKSTDKIYKAAAEIHAHKLEAFNNSKLNLDSLIPDDLCKVPIIQVDIRKPSTKFNSALWEQTIKKISAVFNKYPFIESSNVELQFMEADVYFINSEGSSVIQTITSAAISVMASVEHSYGFKLDDQLQFSADIPDHLAGYDSIVSVITLMAENLRKLQNANLMDQNYSGPVLLIDEAASSFVENMVKEHCGNFVSRRKNTYLNNDGKVEINRYFNQGIDSEIGKQVIDTNISIYSMPYLKKYNNQYINAAFEYDAEGVKPPDTLEVVKNGTLKHLLNGRTPTTNVPISNGHKRYYANTNNLYGQVAPGPLYFEIQNPLSLDSLKKQLIKMALAEGLDFAIIARKNKAHSFTPTIPTIYKVDLKNGNEEQMLSGGISGLSGSDFKNIAGFSSEKYIHQPVSGASVFSFMLGIGDEQVPASYIHPKGILLKSFEIDLIEEPLNKEEKFIPSPLLQ